MPSVYLKIITRKCKASPDFEHTYLYESISGLIYLFILLAKTNSI